MKRRRFYIFCFTIVIGCASSVLHSQEAKTDNAPYLAATEHLDFNRPIFGEILKKKTTPEMTLEQKLESLFNFVRDEIPFDFAASAVSFKASEVLSKQRGFCYLKAMAYVALARKLGVPAKLALERFFIRAHPPGSYHHYHGIAAILYKGRWIYLDTVSNDDAWKNVWTKENPAPFKPPRFRLDGHVVIDQAYVRDLKFEDYETNDIPARWLDQMKEYVRTGKWLD